MPIATFGTALQTEVRSFLGTPDEVRRTANAYFSSIHYRLPIISEPGFYENLSRLFTPSGIDFTTLCLCMKLIHKSPLQQAAGETDTVSSHYLIAKRSIGFLEATGVVTLHAIQSRLLLVLYEVGHGIYPAASVSIGSCARLARNAGLSRDSWHSQEATGTSGDAEERKRTWWAVHNLDRYVRLSRCCRWKQCFQHLNIALPITHIPIRFIALCGGDAILASEDATTDTYLPSEPEQLSCTVSLYLWEGKPTTPD